MNTYLLEQIRCPITGLKLRYEPQKERVTSANNKYAYPIFNGIPLLIVEEAINLQEE